MEASPRLRLGTLFHLQHDWARYRISDPQAAAKVFEHVAERVEGRDHVRPGGGEAVHIVPFGDDAISPFAGLDQIGVPQARPIALGPRWASMNSSSRPGFTLNRTALNAVMSFLPRLKTA